MRLILCLAALGAAALAFLPHSEAGGKGKPSEWTTEFPLEKGELVSTGRNNFFVLEPGHVLILEDGTDKLVITVTNQTKMVGPFETRIIEERETKNGKLTQLTRGYFAISKKTKNVYYFGVDVDSYEDGKVTGHEGAWLHGVKGAKFGMAMPGTIVLKAKYQQEQAPDVALDRGENISVTETVVTPAGTFKNCLQVEETTPLRADYKADKFHAPGIGIIQDGSMKLTKHGFARPK